MNYVIKIYKGNELIGTCKDVILLQNNFTGNRNEGLITVMHLDKSKATYIFNKSIIHPAAQAHPFHINIELNNQEIMKIQNAWMCTNPEGYSNEEMKNLSQTQLLSYIVDDVIIIENLYIEYETILGKFNS